MSQTIYVVTNQSGPVAAFTDKAAAERYVAERGSSLKFEITEVTLDAK